MSTHTHELRYMIQKSRANRRLLELQLETDIQSITHAARTLPLEKIAEHVGISTTTNDFYLGTINLRPEEDLYLILKEINKIFVERGVVCASRYIIKPSEEVAIYCVPIL